jgi:Fe2+ transport system protein FeoA
MVCCPRCGYSWVDDEQTRLGRMLRGLFERGQQRPSATGRLAATLVEVPAGWRARLLSWEALPAARRQQLRAYGLGEQDWIHVLQHSPTTVIRVRHTELALERELAAAILVEAAEPPTRGR